MQMLDYRTELPGLDCGLCGFPTCDLFATALQAKPQLMERCTMRSPDKPTYTAAAAAPAAADSLIVLPTRSPTEKRQEPWHDRLGRPFEFYMDVFPQDRGPREAIIPRNPLRTRELEIQPGDLLLGRPSGMSCGCPLTHVGVAERVDAINGVIEWCITGPLTARQGNPKNIGYYEAIAYDGIIKEKQPDCEIQIGVRYFFQPRRCMMQWRHSGLITFLNQTPYGLQAHAEGLMIG
jgi:uncharacterized Fe-S cluster-containing protein